MYSDFGDVALQGVMRNFKRTKRSLPPAATMFASYGVLTIRKSDLLDKRAK